MFIVFRKGMKLMPLGMNGCRNSGTLRTHTFLRFLQCLTYHPHLTKILTLHQQQHIPTF